MSSDERADDEPGRVVGISQDQTRRWCAAGTFVLAFLGLASLLVLGILERPTPVLIVTAGADVGVLAAWERILSFYFRVPEVVTPPSPTGRDRQYITAHDDEDDSTAA